MPEAERLAGAIKALRPHLAGPPMLALVALFAGALNAANSAAIAWIKFHAPLAAQAGSIFNWNNGSTFTTISSRTVT